MIDAVFVPRGAEERAVRAGLGRRSKVAVYGTGIGSSAATAAVEAVIAGAPAGGVPRRVLVT